MKQIYLLFIGLFIIAISSNAQTLRGKIIDENNKPLAYANVVLQTADSMYVAGTTSNTEGRFEIAMNEKAKWINISFVGYNTIFKKINQYDWGIIRLSPDTNLLDEVVVKGRLPKTQVKGDAMVTLVMVHC